MVNYELKHRLELERINEEFEAARLRDFERYWQAMQSQKRILPRIINARKHQLLWYTPPYFYAVKPHRWKF